MARSASSELARTGRRSTSPASAGTRPRASRSLCRGSCWPPAGSRLRCLSRHSGRPPPPKRRAKRPGDPPCVPRTSRLDPAKDDFPHDAVSATTREGRLETPPRVSRRPRRIQGQASRDRRGRQATAPRAVHEPGRDRQASRFQVRGIPMKAIVASGKRKTAVARATLTKGRGVVRINSVPVEIYPFELGRLKILEPLKLAGKKVDTIDIDVNVQGGGVMGQADAVRTAIARGLVQYLNDNDLETVFREYDRTLIVPDTRRKLPKKPLGRGARKKRQKSYR